MDIPSKYDPSLTEDKWYAVWMKNRYFRSVPDDREPFCIVIPPPNVTGVLHMGHILNNTIQDILVRRARMQGKNALWLPGTDHASIATEAKVVAHLRERGVEKSDITRDEFLRYAWEWREKHGGIILEQLKKLGASCDWERTRFTMDEALYESVINVFIDLYNKGLIYRGVRMINWDPKALTAVSDEEVRPQEMKSKLYYVRYRIENSKDEWVTVATTRPETILGDTAICMNPADKRYKHLAGRRVLVPLIDRPIPIIFDEYVDMEFGTGCLKITPAHDMEDYRIGVKHKLPVIDVFNDDGTMSQAAQLYIGEDRFIVRDKISEELEAKGHMVRIEDYINRVGFSERTNVAIEPRLSLQWFLKMEALAPPALEVVLNNTVRFHPAKFKNTYRHWMENVRDWCISRQLWWGHRIPAYYLPDNDIIVAKSAEEALRLAQEKYPEKNIRMDDLRQDEDVLDTWFSSWLWPISVFDGIRYPDNPDIRYYYPTNDLITAPEILFFWVARMIMAGLEYRREVPFRNVYLTGIVRDKLGRKMSKSLGNSPDPIQLMEKYGADGTRVGMLLTSPAGNDLPFEEVLCEQGRNFSNKIWNALRLVKGWQVDNSLRQGPANKIAVTWFESRFHQALHQLGDLYQKYRISEALMLVYKLIWDDFCSWYLEMIKPEYEKPIDRITYEATVQLFEKQMQILHPFMPFITEEIWHLLRDRQEADCIMISGMPVRKRINHRILQRFDYERDVIIALRSVRKDKKIPLKEALELSVKKNFGEESHTAFDPIICKLCNLTGITYVEEKPLNTLSFIIRSTEFYIPFSSSPVDSEAEILKLEEERTYQLGFLEAVDRKLSNERFIQSAPAAVVDKERKKKADAEARLKVIEEQLAALRK